jgi:hypothetical protein
VVEGVGRVGVSAIGAEGHAGEGGEVKSLREESSAGRAVGGELGAGRTGGVAGFAERGCGVLSGGAVGHAGSAAQGKVVLNAGRGVYLAGGTGVESIICTIYTPSCAGGTLSQSNAGKGSSWAGRQARII